MKLKIQKYDYFVDSVPDMVLPGVLVYRLVSTDTGRVLFSSERISEVYAYCWLHNIKNDEVLKV